MLQPFRTSHFQHSNTKSIQLNDRVLALIALCCVLFIHTSSARCNHFQSPIEIDVTNAGAYGDGVHDDYAAIQAAIDSAALNGGQVYLPTGTYNVSNTLSLPSGVTLAGAGRGKSATLTPNSGSLIRNTSTLLTIRVTGHNAVIRDLIVYDTDNAGSAGGIEILADSSDVESIVIERVLISGFTDGAALSLKAINGGGIAYCSFYDVRIRHAQTGILIEEDATSFVNSNSFYHGAISGGGFDYCLHVKGGNNNIFVGTIMEPYTSDSGHLVVEQGEISGIDIRIEGNAQPDSIPLVEFKENTRKSFLSGTYSGGLTIDKGANVITLLSGKSLGTEKPGENAFVNARFNGLRSNSLPYWEVGHGSVQLESMPSEILTGHQVVKLSIPPGITTYLRPTPEYLPRTLNVATYDYVNFGAYVKTDQANLITTTCRAPAGLTTGFYHSGNSEWQLIGMTSAVNQSISYDARFHIDHSSGIDTAIIYITTPTLSFGMSLPTLRAGSISETHGIMNQTLTTGLLSDSTVSTGFLVLEPSANTFEISGTHTISRINHAASDRFPRGTVITLLFNNAGTTVINGAYITLLSGYTSTANGSLTLISDGDGTWRELNRNL